MVTRAEIKLAKPKLTDSVIVLGCQLVAKLTLVSVPISDKPDPACDIGYELLVRRRKLECPV